MHQEPRAPSQSGPQGCRGGGLRLSAAPPSFDDMQGSIWGNTAGNVQPGGAEGI